jgi:hypothetical protein
MEFIAGTRISERRLLTISLQHLAGRQLEAQLARLDGRGRPERGPHPLRREAKPMLRLFLEVSMLAFEAQHAIWLRSIRIAAGGRAAKRETNLMAKEKISAAQAAVFKAATGTGPVAI